MNSKICQQKNISQTNNEELLITKRQEDITSETKKESLEEKSTNQKPSKYWSFERCGEIASKCLTLKEFRDLYPGAYRAVLQKGWAKEIISNLPKRGSKYTFDYCLSLALTCEYKRDFIRNYGSAYWKCRKEGWWEVISPLLKSVGNLYFRMVYAYEFSDKSVYVGLTFDETSRRSSHFSSTKKHVPVKAYFELTGLTPKYIAISDYLEVALAQDLERKKIEEYRNLGWNVLNTRKGGATGCPKLIWTKEKCKMEALKYNVRQDFVENSISAYASCLKHGWLEEVCGHLPRIKKPRGHWNNIENCVLEARKYKSKTDFCEGSYCVYYRAYQMGFLDIICKEVYNASNPT